MGTQIDMGLRAFEKLLHDMKKVLGPNHRDVLLTNMQFATCLEKSGRLAKAEATLAWSIEEQARVLGSDYPEALNICRLLKRLRSNTKSN
jgi:hypothetical protein